MSRARTGVGGVVLATLLTGSGAARAEDTPAEIFFDRNTQIFSAPLPAGQPFKIKVRMPPGGGGRVAYVKRGNRVHCPSDKLIYVEGKTTTFAMINNGAVAADGSTEWVATIGRLSVGEGYCFAFSVNIFEALSAVESKAVDDALNKAVDLTVGEMYSGHRPTAQARSVLVDKFEQALRESPALAHVELAPVPRNASSVVTKLESTIESDNNLKFALTRLATAIGNAATKRDSDAAAADADNTAARVRFNNDRAWTDFKGSIKAVGTIYAKSRLMDTSATAGQARSFYLSLDVGLGAGLFPGKKSSAENIDVFQYLGVNFYFSPVDKDEPVTAATPFRKRFSMTAGLSLLGPSAVDDDGVKGLLGGQRLLLAGAGYRASTYVRFGAGAVMYRFENPHPLSNQKGFGVSPYLSASLDFDTFGWLSGEVKKL